MRQSFWTGIEVSFKNKPEECKRAIAIYWAMLHRIRYEVLPYIEDVIGRNIKHFLILPKRLNPEEIEKVMEALCHLPLLYAIPHIHGIYNDAEKAERTIAFLIEYFNLYLNIDPDEIIELGKLNAIGEGGDSLSSVMNKICAAIDIIDPFMALEFMPSTDKLVVIGVETADVFCTCDEEDIIKLMQVVME